MNRANVCMGMLSGWMPIPKPLVGPPSRRMIACLRSTATKLLSSSMSWSFAMSLSSCLQAFSWKLTK